MTRRRQVVGGAIAALLLLSVPAATAEPARPSHEAAGSGLVGYSALANAPGIGIDGIYMGVSLDLPEVSSSLTTGGVGAGLASIAWPGDIGGNAGTAVLVLDPTAPSWVKLLNDPVKAEAHSTGAHHAINRTLPGTVMESSATHRLVTASSQTKTELPLLGSLGAFSGSSSAKLVGPHTVRAVAHSALTDLDLAGGLIKIGALVSDAVVVSTGSKSHGHAATTVTGVTIAGLPVTIDRDGIHLAKSLLPDDAATSLLTKTLAALHIKVTFTPTQVTRDGGAASYNSGALVLTYRPGDSTYSLTLGRAAAQVNATPSLLPGAVSTPTTTPQSGGSTAGGSTPNGADAGSVGLPGTGAISTGPTDGRTPSVAQRIVDRASGILLAGGPTGAMVAGLIAAVVICGLGLPRIAGRLLDAPAGADCEEDEG